ncbi:MAG: hypothetical protein NTU44_05290 [Bacteroidetes bacterium]|nr:hypothetical protein [Bacteroidota bacterium]
MKTLHFSIRQILLFLLCLAILAISSCGTRLFNFSISLNLPDTSIKEIRIALVRFDPVKTFSREFDFGKLSDSLRKAQTPEEKSMLADTLLSVGWSNMLAKNYKDELWPLVNGKFLEPAVSQHYTPFISKHFWLVSNAFKIGNQLCCYSFFMDLKEGTINQYKLDKANIIVLKETYKEKIKM